jgi:hypothetical protein
MRVEGFVRGIYYVVEYMPYRSFFDDTGNNETQVYVYLLMGLVFHRKIALLCI